MVTQVQTKNRKITWQELNTTRDASTVRDVIARETRNWEASLLVVGLIQIVASAFRDPGWGILLIVVAACSYYFRSAAMFPVYGVTIAWAMICNLLSGDPRWMAFGLLQGYWTFTTFRQFLMIRGATERLGIGLNAGLPDRADRAAGIFSWTGCALSAAAWLGSVSLIAVVVISYALTEQAPDTQVLEITADALMDSACLGLGLAVAAILSRFRRRPVSILGALGGVLFLGFSVMLVFLGS